MLRVPFGFVFVNFESIPNAKSARESLACGAGLRESLSLDACSFSKRISI